MRNSHKYDAVILTEARYVKLKENDIYSENVMKEDGMLKTALEEKGLKVERLSWDDPDFDWASTRYVIFRSTWDYFFRFAEFSEWLERAKGLTEMVNPNEMIRWNMDKHYLADLQAKGIPIPPTLFLETGEKRSLTEIARAAGWKDMILKPAISGGAYHTYRLNPENIPEHEAIFRELISSESMLLQEFQESVIEDGEIAFMLFGGKFSHAILKIAKEGDFRVQDDFGGSVHDYTALTTEIEFAEKVVSVCDPVPVYARVDVIRNNEGNLCLTELELIEPEIWLRNQPEAAMLFAESFIEYIRGE